MHNYKFVPASNETMSNENTWYEKQEEANTDPITGVNYVPGTNKSISIENTWYKKQEEDNAHVVSGVTFIGLIILAKIILMF